MSNTRNLSDLARDTNLKEFGETFTLPTTDGSSGQVLSTNGSGGLSFTTPPAGYANSDVDSHLNTGTATTDQVLSWTGADYDWVNVSEGANYVYVANNYTASSGDFVITNTSNTAFTVTLPATPSVGHNVIIADADDWSVNNLTVARNGSTIEGVAEDIIMDVGGVSTSFIYDGTTWQLYPWSGAISSTSGSTVEWASILNKPNFTNLLNFSDAVTLPSADGTSGQTLKTDGSGVLSFSDAAYINIPPVGSKTSSYTLQTSDVSKFVEVGTGGSIIIPNATFSSGDAISIFNNTSGDVTVTCNPTNSYISGTDTDVASVTLATRGVMTVLFITGTTCVLTGSIS